ncbi:MAG: redoxin domain-containing protein [Phycisphaerae bacterium]|nr:redoxin domain-containing protein [Phycisphaerae bacterium]
MRLPPPSRAWAVGEEVPDFTLPDQDGRQVSLADYRGKGPVLLVFYRGFW